MNPQLNHLLAQQRTADLHRIADCARLAASAAAVARTARPTTRIARLSSRVARVTGPVAPGNC